MNNLAKRFATGIPGAFIMISAILWSETSFLLLLILMAVLCLLEFYRLCKDDGVQPQISFGLILGVLPFLAPLLHSAFEIPVNLLPLILIVPSLIFIRELYTHSLKPFTNIAFTLLGFIYIIAPLFMFYLFAFQSSEANDSGYNGGNILGFFMILWSTDIGAYFVGKYLGKHKLFERISPKKTWEGFIGGAVMGTLAAFAVSYFVSSFTLTDWLITAGIIIVSGAFGDLVESLFKRSLNKKDSGNLLPGHGGVLDRFDGLFVSAPFVFVFHLLFS
ncbi:MAG: phosphatidate cytidylyltransferase [Bacteroidetes bacterium]|nr:MAG: phosphatidate cytidylyltransferase [Bacteroidota bacterium]